MSDHIAGITYEVWGITGDDAEQCAASDDVREATRYAAIYAEDYDEVRMYSVERVQELRIRRAGGAS